VPHLNEDAGSTVAVLCNAAADEVFHHTLQRIKNFTNVFGARRVRALHLCPEAAALIEQGCVSADSAQSGCICWCHLALTDGHTKAASGICWTARSMSENSQRRQHGRGGGTRLQHGVVEALAPLLQRDIQAAVDLVKLLQALPVTQPSDPVHPVEAQAAAVQPRDLEQWRRMRSSTLDRCIPACWHPGTSVGNVSRRGTQLNGLRTLRLMAHSSFQAARNAGSPDCSLVTASRARALKSSSSSNRFFDSLHIGKDACSRPISAQEAVGLVAAGPQA